MAKKAEKKTNAMRALDTAGIAYTAVVYEFDDENFDGLLVADKTGLPPEAVFKTLVTLSDNSEVVVCCIPVDKKLDLKTLAAASGHKRLEMAHVNEILGLTGYIRGGCSPVGMKKRYPTFIDETALLLDKIAVSAGIRGQQLYLDATDLIRFTGAVTGSFTMDNR